MNAKLRLRLPAGVITADQQIWLHFGGINYRAGIWLNGKQIAGPERVAGMWRTYEINVIAEAHRAK
ncbi:MAG TPA: hypothetical protein VFJ52_10480 [Terriglobia bacterium]|nr:hypothetical protein [Terriglobia bacterium]